MGSKPSKSGASMADWLLDLATERGIDDEDPKNCMREAYPVFVGYFYQDNLQAFCKEVGA
ncbi:hypothetical protein [Streptomyces sp. NBC_00094]|uniref:hypothetical protein n=1 Tax=Streptomyces sp. NBC_00094 TaxID=2903620 RepID=UPI002258E64D|nr:hypothetical protein [Streptomyces sp. NBC_00094]MCX5394977.1 hypothetical protein [Streptomyces sp. NBC_00094]